MENPADIPPSLRTRQTIKLEKLGRIRFRAVQKHGWFVTRLEWVAEEELKETFIYRCVLDSDLDIGSKQTYERIFWQIVKPEDCLMLQFTVPAT